MVSPKKLCWNLIFLVLSGKMIFLFPENMMLPPNGKWKMIFLKKIHRNIIFSSNIQKGSRLDMIFLALSRKVVFFFQKTWYFFPGRKTGGGWPFSRNTRKHGFFYLICSTPPAPPCEKKNQRRSYPAKIHLKVTGIPDRLPRKSSSNSLYLHGDL